MVDTEDRMELTVYSARWCHQCRVARAFLDEHNIPYIEVDIDEDPEAAAELERGTGKRAIPHFRLNGEWVQPYVPRLGFKFKEMRELFGLDQLSQVQSLKFKVQS